ncbi:hypothetical protein OUZ56_028011 [Daphnia magna]|uniref:Uncharacterized protein n=1 Tax=Daphnia magna TaxID=35525 RepID=A0ABR0B2L2_9CRUS|nr:hypothetical protein OUZ56_028011 [Daphnia magna]
MFRFIANARKNRERRINGLLEEEINLARNALLRHAQSNVYRNECVEVNRQYAAANRYSPPDYSASRTSRPTPELHRDRAHLSAENYIEAEDNTSIPKAGSSLCVEVTDNQVFASPDVLPRL